MRFLLLIPASPHVHGHLPGCAVGEPDIVVGPRLVSGLVRSPGASNRRMHNKREQRSHCSRIPRSRSARCSAGDRIRQFSYKLLCLFWQLSSVLGFVLGCAHDCYSWTGYVHLLLFHKAVLQLSPPFTSYCVSTLSLPITHTRRTIYTRP
ncbi:hypothetical protein BDW22DRAFT_77987 [Trametopsis cervina]|nr:hypothetical protein BDW22DRAFT_77987 [Trametopsis cervina]